MTINHDRIKLCRDREVPEWIRKARDKLPPDTMADANQFCICRGPDTGSFMIQCDECREWYHESCVNVDKKSADDFAYYLCPSVMLVDDKPMLKLV